MSSRNINSRRRPPLSGARKLPSAATMALEMIGPMPRTVIRRSHAESAPSSLQMSADEPSMRSSSRRQLLARSSTARIIGQRQCIRARGEDAWQLCALTAEALAHRNPAFQQEGANLIDDAGALANQPSRTRCSACKSSCSTVLVATNFIGNGRD